MKKILHKYILTPDQVERMYNIKVNKPCEVTVTIEE